MGREIERKFLVTSRAYAEQGKAERYLQGYLSTEPGRTVRVRIAGESAFLTIKGAAAGISRDEYEYAIPLSDAEAMLKNLCKQPVIHKIRYKIRSGPFIWEVDEFHGENEGLVVAEIELPSPDTEFPKPEWLGEEVSSDHRYANSSLVQYPFSRWNTPDSM